jgi:hypothetical protein
MRLVAYLTTISLLLSLAQTIRAQGLVIDGFMRGQRKANLWLNYSQASYDTYYVNKTETRNPNLGTVTTKALTAQGAYGLGYDLDLLVSASYIRTETSAGYVPKQEGFQDISAAFRWEAYDYKFGKTRLTWLFTLGYSIPLQNYVSDELTAIGRGSRNLDVRTMLHYKAGPFFLTGQYGYIRMGQVTLDRIVNYYDPSQLNPNSGSKVNVPDVTDLIIRTGLATKWLYVDVWGEQQKPYNSGTNIGPGIPFPTNAVGFTRLGANLYLPIAKQLGLTAGYTTTLSGRNTGKATRINAGLVVGMYRR